MSEPLRRLVDNVARVIRGKRESIEIVVAALAAEGHVLLEDVPGVGKTVLARALARSLSSDFRRIQCTPDLLPSDVTGGNVFHPGERTFEFHPGPIFSTVLLVDEINRATPRTQSALLEAMEERQVTADGVTRPLPAPFFLIATQNPIELTGTFPLPEAQLDRFLVSLSLGYPDPDTEVEILGAQLSGHPLEYLESCLSREELQEVQRAVRKIHVHESILRYVQRIVATTRQDERASYGASPRGGLALVRSAQGLAALLGEDFVTPDHIKRLAPPVLGHRVVVSARSRVQRIDGASIVGSALKRVEVPIGLEDPT